VNIEDIILNYMTINFPSIHPSFFTSLNLYPPDVILHYDFVALSGEEVTHLFNITRSEWSLSRRYVTTSKLFSCVPCHILSLTHLSPVSILLCLRWT